MVCEASMTFGDYITQFEFIKAFSCTYFSSAGMLVAGLLVFGGVIVSIAIRTNSVVIPVILVLLTGGAILPQVAGVGVTIVTVMLLVTGAGVITMLYRRYSR